MAKKKIQQGMIDIHLKKPSFRVARASCDVVFSKRAFDQLVLGNSPKGDVLATAKVAGILAAKQTSGMIPMCHPLLLEKVSVDLRLDHGRSSVHIVSEVICQGKTGVEMEALCAVAVAGLTVYDMMKWADHKITISDMKLLHKSGGKSGVFCADQ